MGQNQSSACCQANAADVSVTSEPGNQGGSEDVLPQTVGSQSVNQSSGASTKQVSQPVQAGSAGVPALLATAPTGAVQEKKAEPEAMPPDTTGAVYQGEMLNGKRHGVGLLTLADGTKYEGEFRDDKMTGKGKMSYNDGDYYLGEWKNGLANGGGAYDQSARGGGRYEGYWLNDKRHGYGEEKCPDGSYYKGQWFKGQKDGMGIIKDATGGEYKGQFKAGSLHGKGTMNWGNGDIYKGQWRKGARAGKGLMQWKTEEECEYSGQWKEGKFHGLGVIRNAMGEKMGGEWKNGYIAEYKEERYRFWKVLEVTEPFKVEYLACKAKEDAQKKAAAKRAKKGQPPIEEEEIIWPWTREDKDAAEGYVTKSQYEEKIAKAGGTNPVLIKPEKGKKS
eukprot:gnl/TRDRNA2_/TRDRNA2_175568_c0_seq1.p1 gnl/TRDRNA2_/TRDRNA2_175568_c0~~gnl/TRDRNA2_/TRDRNA2_175568_c0_seq1.p1  ORF type:complete len:391 (-),score=97.55 gnl/TRDRNA2_/TRDRNA2_175568_c0_seq1:145-1317(-)